MINFAAIDFETANGKRTSVCSVGVVIVREGKITNKIYRLIRPRPNYYTQWTTAVHGLTSGSMGGNQTIDRRSATCSAQQSF